MLFSIDRRHRTDEVLSVLASVPFAKGTDLMIAVGKNSITASGSIDRLLARGLVAASEPLKGSPRFVSLNRQHPAAGEIERYLLAVAKLREPFAPPPRPTRHPALAPSADFDGRRLLGNYDRTALLVLIAVLGEIRSSRAVSYLNIAEWQVGQMLAMWRMRGFTSRRRVKQDRGTPYDFGHSLNPRFPAHAELRALLLKMARVYFPEFRQRYKPANERNERRISGF